MGPPIELRRLREGEVDLLSRQYVPVVAQHEPTVRVPELAAVQSTFRPEASALEA